MSIFGCVSLKDKSKSLVTFVCRNIEYKCRMIVCIAEKPSVARDIAKVLGANSPKIGYIEGNNYCVTWTYGHLCTLKEPHDYNPEWKRWSLSHLPIIPDNFGIKLIDDNGVKQQFEVIQHLVAKAEYVVNCGDAGQEGELIQRWVLQLAGCKVPVKRLWLSSMTEEAIREAFENLKPDKEYQNLYYAGLTRAISDWILGLNATRLYTQKYKPIGAKGIISVGRVQTPTLALIVERQDEIDNFVSQPFWEIKTLYREVTFSSTKGRYLKKEEAEEVLQKIKSNPLTITKVEKKKGKEGPPRLFDLTSLQIECNKKWSYTADDTLKIAQSLYEKQLLTYPRVDTTYLTDDIFKRVPNILNSLNRSNYSVWIAPLLHGGKKLKKNKKFFNNAKVTDHHAIIPTGIIPRGINKEEMNVYDIVTKRFIAAFYEDAIINNTTILAEVEGIPFKATGKKTEEPAWKVIFEGPEKSDKVEDEDEEGENDSELAKELPTFKKGESGPHKPDLIEKSTQPPRPYTEATLLNAMETAGKLVDDEELKDAMKQKGIGRPSTRSAIIETIQKRGYVEKVRKNLIPTNRGKQLIRTIHNEELKSVRLTGEWEYKLQLIDKGEYAPEEFLQEMKAMVQKLVHEVVYGVPNVYSNQLRENSIPPIGANTGITCPFCKKGTIIKGKSAYGCSRFYDGCKETVPFEELPANKTLNDIEKYLLSDKVKEKRDE